MTNEMASSETKSNIETRTREKEVVIERIFDAPREMVWKAWTDPDTMKQWWGPKDFTSPVVSVDLDLGGSYLHSMRSPEGEDFWSTGVYKDIREPELLVMTDSFADKDGNVVPASYYGMNGNWAREMLITVRLEEENGRTKMTLTHSGIDGFSMKDIDNMQQGWNQSFDKLEEVLKNAR
jgi:uncharacterized protein YndB with AHSA1/START domain